MNTSLPAPPKLGKISPKRLHKMAADALRAAYDTGEWETYRYIATFLTLPLPKTFEEISDRYHFHLKHAEIAHREHNLLIPHTDSTSNTPFLPIHIYLENLRSAHNVGSIFRTTEALRLGTIHLSPTTPTPESKKVRDAAMGTCTLVPYTTSTLDDLPRPLIALETSPSATPIEQFAFPHTFTLLVGNEEYGLSAKALSMADHVVTIPLVGAKNSLNVANAFAICASYVGNSVRSS